MGVQENSSGRCITVGKWQNLTDHSSRFYTYQWFTRWYNTSRVVHIYEKKLTEFLTLVLLTPSSFWMILRMCRPHVCGEFSRNYFLSKTKIYLDWVKLEVLCAVVQDDSWRNWVGGDGNEWDLYLGCWQMLLYFF